MDGSFSLLVHNNSRMAQMMPKGGAVHTIRRKWFDVHICLLASRAVRQTEPVSLFHILPEIIRFAVMVYVRFHLSLRNVADLLYLGSIEVCHDTIYNLSNKFGLMFAYEASKKRVNGVTIVMKTSFLITVKRVGRTGLATIIRHIPLFADSSFIGAIESQFAKTNVLLSGGNIVILSKNISAIITRNEIEE